MITDRPTCPICHEPYANTRDGCNVHSGTARHRAAVAAAVGRKAEPADEYDSHGMPLSGRPLDSEGR